MIANDKIFASTCIWFILHIILLIISVIHATVLVIHIIYRTPISVGR